MIDQTTTIVAVATATGGAISLIRLSGPDSAAITGRVFSGKLRDRVAVFGAIADGGKVIDEALATLFEAPRSYTGQQSVEISCHGSAWITGEIVRLLVKHGAFLAQAGEFTLRGFLNGKMDLSQAEAVADIIASESQLSATIALNQMRGGYSLELKELSSELLNILSLLELELDFGEEEVEFADRTTLLNLIIKIATRVAELAASFKLGNVLKNGVPVAIVGSPNVGKSTLLNQLLGEERAIVSPIAGTTRDFIEEQLSIDGLKFRFIDTAGLRSSNDEIERMGIERSYEKLRSATIVILMVESLNNIVPLGLTTEQKLIIVLNKCDQHIDNSSADQQKDNDSTTSQPQVDDSMEHLQISAKYGAGIDTLKRKLVESINLTNYDSSSIIVSNARHHQALELSLTAFQSAQQAIHTGYATDLIAADIRIALTHLSEITGEITTDDILANIFSKFCIGK